MKRIRLFLSFFLLAFISNLGFLYAQNSTMGKISGRVLDKSKAQPVEFANVVVKRSGDSTVVKGVVTDPKGEFVLENLKFGQYDLTVFFVGYQKLTLTKVMITPQGPNARLEKIELTEDSKQLAEITVEGKAEFIQTTPDGIIVTPSANPTQTGGTATDVLQQVPSVQVDANGGVTLRGGNPNILINGRNSSFGGGGGRGMGMGGGGGGGGLDQISADEIESIEINTNPSARFDADGVGGMINIRLKRDRQLGTHGNFNFNLGNRWRTGLGGRINHRTDKWNFFASYFGRLDKRLGEDLTERFTDTYTSLNPIIDRTYLNQARNNRTVGQFHNVRAGIDYYFSEKESITFEAMYGFRNFESTGALRSRTVTANDNSFRLGNNQDNTTLDKGNNYEFSLNYKKEFAKKRQEMMASITTSFGDGRQILDLVNQAVLADGSILDLPSNLQQNGLNANRNNTTSMQFDYSHPVGKNGLFETGYKGIIRTLNTDADWSRLNRQTQVFEPNNLISNAYSYDENVQAIYTAYKNKWGKFDYNAGLRFEQVWYGGNLTAENQQENFDRQYFNIFPTARIAYNINQKASEFIKLSYSRRIDRPGFGDLNPFRDISNPLNIRLGNGSGGFTNATDVSVGTNPLAIAVGDFNGDGKPDFATTNTGSNNVSIRLGNGLGGFTNATNVAVGDTPLSIALGDFNNDGNPDFAVVNQFSDNVSIRLGNGAGGFSTVTDVAVGSFPNSIAVGDFNGDDNLDFAVADLFGSTVSIRLGNGNGTFTSAANVALSALPTSIAVADFNADGKADFLVSDGFGTNVSIRLGNGNGTFATAPDIAVGAASKFVAIGDFNGDGKSDFATIISSNKTVNIRLGNGSGVLV